MDLRLAIKQLEQCGRQNEKAFAMTGTAFPKGAQTPAYIQELTILNWNLQQSDSSLEVKQCAMGQVHYSR
jgi:hypothetical protein